MSALDDVGSSASVYGPARIVGWVTLLLMLATVVYAIAISLLNLSAIGV